MKSLEVIEASFDANKWRGGWFLLKASDGIDVRLFDLVAQCSPVREKNIERHQHKPMEIVLRRTTPVVSMDVCTRRTQAELPTR